MSKTTVKLSPNFKKKVNHVVLAILLFIFVYLLLVTLSLGLTIASITAGISLILISPSFVTIAVGFGIASFGVLILAFLVKFIFSANKKDKSHLVEIKEKDQTELFKMIAEIVEEVGTQFPKKVYLSAEVNASVFYNSTFWSMFLPVRKNLVIGLALINSVSENELKAILAHEFGHFSQKSMKIGSYVYNVNQIIFNMLYDNDNYSSGINKWMGNSGVLTLFVIIALKVNEGIQFILSKVYTVVNKAFMELSREMEFHADEIAASVTGYEPLANSLLRLSFAENAFNSSLEFYNKRVKDNLKSENIFVEHSFILHFMAEINAIQIKNNLPHIKPNEFEKFNKSKLVIKDQWASHPSIEARIEHLKNAPKNLSNNTDRLASSCINNLTPLQKQLTDIVFAMATYPGEPVLYSFDDFKKEYIQEYEKVKLPEIYRGYYDLKVPNTLTLSELKEDYSIQPSTLFSDEKLDLVYQQVGLKTDLETLNYIKNNKTDIKYFDYDGRKYKKKEVSNLITQLEKELAENKEKLLQNDKLIYSVFLAQTDNSVLKSKLTKYYLDFFGFMREFEDSFEMELQIAQALHFLNFNLPFEEINKQLDLFSPMEDKFKTFVLKMLDPTNGIKLNDENKSALEKYIGNNEKYFYHNVYNETALGILFQAIEKYFMVISTQFQENKQSLLSFQASLLNVEEFEPHNRL